MNKNIKKILGSVLITVLTLIAGFGITVFTFRLSDVLTTNQLRLLFAVDFICLIAVGGVFLCLSESRAAKERSRRSRQKRQEERISEAQSVSGTSRTGTHNSFAA